jgi:hypothetical protein
MSFLVVGALVVGIVVATTIWNRWRHKHVEEAANWPTTTATIQQVEFQEVTSGHKAEEAHTYPCFRFSYAVNNEYYSGIFGLAVEGEAADRLLREMSGRNFTVSYKPAQSSEFYIPGEIMDGYEVLQKISFRGNACPSD